MKTLKRIIINWLFSDMEIKIDPIDFEKASLWVERAKNYKRKRIEL